MKNVLLFTHSYPYTKNSETFLESEIALSSTLKDVKITLIPLVKNDYKRDSPSNIDINDGLNNLSLYGKMKILFQMFFSLWFWRLLRVSSFSLNIKKIVSEVKYLYGSIWISNFILAHKELWRGETVFYSYWFNHTPLGFYLAKCQNKDLYNYRFYTRAHGFDLYESERKVYIPYREQAMQGVNAVFAISDVGASFLKKKYSLYQHKIMVSRLGVLPIPSSNEKKKKIEKIEFISCSSVWHLKRVDLILKSIVNYSRLNPAYNITWTHIGDGCDMDKLRKQVSEYKNEIINLKVKLLGTITNTDIRQLYSRNDFDIFINLSVSEGIPVSIMEAIAAGIPVIATDVGGTREIVGVDTGYLLPVNFEQKEFNCTVNKLMKNIEKLHHSSYLFFNEYYNAQKNYTNFYQLI